MLDQIRDAGVLAGISVNPGTPVTLLDTLRGRFDLALVMSVHPGFGGQSFIDNALEKIQTLASWRAGSEQYLIEVDGGINTRTAGLAAAAGADILVAGNAVFAAPDPVLAVSELREAARR
jgi:ribulose-phosphate 3-epimerase